jgi:hypothetical protein
VEIFRIHLTAGFGELERGPAHSKSR